MGLPNGVHHLAITTKNMKAQLEFFCDVLGAELKALYWMHGVPDTLHGFVKLADSSYVAFEHNLTDAGHEDPVPSGEDIPVRIGGAMAHVAFNVDTLAEQLVMRDRLRDRGINVVGPLDHGFCHSIYFAGPEGLTLEVATSAAPIDERAWIDPECAALVGLDAAAVERCKRPADYAGQGGSVPQPPFDADRVIYFGAPRLFEKVVAMSDDEVTDQLSMPTPPVAVAGTA